MMDDKTQIIIKLRDEFGRWEELLSGLSEEQIRAPDRIEALSIKDIVAHLTTWQEISVARMEAGLQDSEPVFPGWPAEMDPDTDTDLDLINAWIYESHHGTPWEEIHREWKERFLRFIELGEAMPEKELMEAGRYAWIEGYALAAVLVSSYEHHEEHLEQLVELLRQGKIG
jgi:hypothetical protein